ncbi:unnamed protein product [Cyprideis torosa]|uniref:Large ribosomal subunit protein mL39 n=1 Tax=Cyprideis torosa TaxID=163714 RepID=A0A7R8WA25_9CRUS|nr:unnamed protein product [Cyprideis torosa]CAG0887932.1 unnamed protein product [Cyprideis torosa]
MLLVGSIASFSATNSSAVQKATAKCEGSPDDLRLALVIEKSHYANLNKSRAITEFAVDLVTEILQKSPKAQIAVVHFAKSSQKSNFTSNLYELTRSLRESSNLTIPGEPKFPIEDLEKLFRREDPAPPMRSVLVLSYGKPSAGSMQHSHAFQKDRGVSVFALAIGSEFDIDIQSIATYPSPEFSEVVPSEELLPLWKWKVVDGLLDPAFKFFPHFSSRSGGFKVFVHVPWSCLIGNVQIRPSIDSQSHSPRNWNDLTYWSGLTETDYSETEKEYCETWYKNEPSSMDWYDEIRHVGCPPNGAMAALDGNFVFNPKCCDPALDPRCLNSSLQDSFPYWQCKDFYRFYVERVEHCILSVPKVPGGPRRQCCYRREGNTAGLNGDYVLVEEHPSVGGAHRSSKLLTRDSHYEQDFKPWVACCNKTALCHETYFVRRPAGAAKDYHRIDANFRNDVDGLLGQWNGNPDDDLQPNDATLPPIPSEMVKNLSLVHKEFGLSWNIHESESLFMYYTSNYSVINNLDYQPVFDVIDLSEQDPDLWNKTLELCAKRELLSSQKRWIAANSSTAPSVEEIQDYRCQLFEEELNRQKSLIGRIERIKVHYHGQPDDIDLLMNKGLSTPYDCARHISEMIMTRSALAEVDGELWDLNRPLVKDCHLRLLHFKDKEPFQVNKAFWRSCSFLLGSVLETAFKEQHFVELVSFPPPNLRSGSFVYDADLKISDWKPRKEELRILSAKMAKLAHASLDFDRLDISLDLALEMFQHNRYKREQVPHIAAASQQSVSRAVTVYRVGKFVDISRGPMISNTRYLGRVTIGAVHPLNNEGVYRVQGVALPTGLMLNHFAWGLLENRSKSLNPARTAFAPEALKSKVEDQSELNV